MPVHYPPTARQPAWPEGPLGHPGLPDFPAVLAQASGTLVCNCAASLTQKDG